MSDKVTPLSTKFLKNRMAHNKNKIPVIAIYHIAGLNRSLNKYWRAENDCTKMTHIK